MADAIAREDVPISFADTSNFGTLRFYDATGVRPLSEMCRRIGSRLGEERQPPPWYSPNVLDVVHSPEFCSALISLTAHEFREQGSGFSVAKPLQLQSEFDARTQVIFVREIEAEYRIARVRVHVPEDISVEPDRFVCVWVRSRSELRGLLSRAIAGLLVNSPAKQRGLSDSIYRLLDCSSAHEMERYLRSRGVPWTASTTSDDEVGGSFAEDSDAQAEHQVREMIANVIATQVGSRTQTDGSGVSSETTAGQTTGGQTPTPPPEHPTRSMPPLESVTPHRAEASDSWSPSTSSVSGTGGRSWPWTPPSQSDGEWERAIGRQGEEIIYREEVARVTAMGYPESRVIWTSDKDPGADHDIQSVDDDGQTLWMEVKSSAGRDGRFRWPRAEFEKAIRHRTQYVIWRVYEADTTNPTIKAFRDPIGLLIRNGMGLDISSLAAEVEAVAG